jgi:hypothetical protein
MTLGDGAVPLEAVILDAAEIQLEKSNLKVPNKEE